MDKPKPVVEYEDQRESVVLSKEMEVEMENSYTPEEMDALNEELLNSQ